MSVERLKPSAINTYGLALFGFNIMMQMNLLYYAFFLTDIALIPAAMMGTIVLVGRIGDMIAVPIVSGLIEKFNLRWGKYRSWLLIGSPLLAIFFTLMFTNPNLSVTGKAIYMVTVYLIAHVFVNFTYAALYALIPIMGKHPEDRTLLSARRSQLYSLGAVVFGLIAMPIILFFSGGDKPALQGFTITTAILTLIMMTTYLLVFRMTKEYDKPTNADPKAAKQPGLTAGEMLNQAIKNPPFLALIFGDIARNIAAFGVTGVAAYYFRYVASDMAMISVFFTTVSVTQFLASILFSYLAKVFDKRTLYISGLAIVVLAQVTAWLVANNAMTFIIVMAFSYMGYAFTTCASPAMYADACDYGEWKTGKSAKGFIMGMANMPPKIALITTGAFTGFALSALGYVANAPATPELVSGIRNLIHLLPAGAAICGIVIMSLFNNLTVSKTQELQQEVQARAVMQS